MPMYMTSCFRRWATIGTHVLTCLWLILCNRNYVSIHGKILKTHHFKLNIFPVATKGYPGTLSNFLNLKENKNFHLAKWEQVDQKANQIGAETL